LAPKSAKSLSGTRLARKLLSHLEASAARNRIVAANLSSKTLLRQSLARADRDWHEKPRATRTSGEAGGLVDEAEVAQDDVPGSSGFFNEKRSSSEKLLPGVLIPKLRTWIEELLPEQKAPDRGAQPLNLEELQQSLRVPESPDPLKQRRSRAA
jgi:hypothetical protein